MTASPDPVIERVVTLFCTEVATYFLAVGTNNLSRIQSYIEWEIGEGREVITMNFIPRRIDRQGGADWEKRSPYLV